MKNYGLPYQGSKNRIIGWLMSALPGADTFVDLFAGGCAVSHAAMVSGRYRQVIANDITDSALVFQDAIRGKFHNERRWISREDFFSLKDHDAYARLCFSFGNDQRSYMYSQQLEPYKRACHEAVVFDRWEMMKQLCPEVYAYVKDDVSRCGQPDTNNYIRVRRTCFQNSVVEALQRNGDDRILQSNPLYASCHFKKNKAKSTSHIRDLECNPNIERLERLQQLETLQSLQSLESLERLQSLERLERLQSLERLGGGIRRTVSLRVSQADYRKVDIPSRSIIYCDPPYQNTKKYLSSFDFDAFYGWCLDNPHPVFISEYNMPEGFTPIAATGISNIMNSDRPVKRVEKIFVQSRFADRYVNPLLAL